MASNPTPAIIRSEWAEAVHDALENHTRSKDEHIDRLIAAGEALAALSAEHPVVPLVRAWQAAHRAWEESLDPRDMPGQLGGATTVRLNRARLDLLAYPLDAPAVPLETERIARVEQALTYMAGAAEGRRYAETAVSRTCGTCRHRTATGGCFMAVQDPEGAVVKDTLGRPWNWRNRETWDCQSWDGKETR